MVADTFLWRHRTTSPSKDFLYQIVIHPFITQSKHLSSVHSPSDSYQPSKAFQIPRILMDRPMNKSKG